MDWLTTPSPDIQDPTRRRLARLQTIFVVSLFLLFLGVIISQYLVFPGYRISSSDICGFAFMIAMFMLRRTRIFPLFFLPMLAMFPINTYANIINGTTSNPTSTLCYLVLSYTICGIFLSMRATAIYGLVVNLVMLLMPTLAPHTIRGFSAILGPLCVNSLAVVITLISMRYRDYVETDHNAALTCAYDATLEGWARALELRDKETEGHSKRVAEMTVALARKLGMSEGELTRVRTGALLHDIGKMGIPDGILLKNGELTDEERKIVREHPTLAHQMLSPIAFLRPALDIPFSHHERWDGNGYPQGLAGEQIPLAARIFAVVDVWDALTHDRPYRSRWTHDKALQYITEQIGIQFDPNIGKMFLELSEIRSHA